MNVEGIGTLLQDAGVGVVGKTIFFYTMPPNIERGILLRDRLQGDRLDQEIVGLVKGGFQLIVRAQTPAAAKALGEDAIAALTLSGVTLDNEHIKYMRARTKPQIFPASESGKIEALIIFDAWYEPV